MSASATQGFHNKLVVLEVRRCRRRCRFWAPTYDVTAAVPRSCQFSGCWQVERVANIAVAEPSSCCLAADSYCATAVCCRIWCCCISVCFSCCSLSYFFQLVFPYAL